MKFKKLTLSILASALFTMASAQDNHMNEVFYDMTGKWSGKAWQKLPSGDTTFISQSENVYTQLNGKILVVNGLGKDEASGKTVFEAFGIINKAPDGSYQMNAYTADGRQTLANIDITEDGFDWWFEIPNRGTIKYTIALTENTWEEKGHFSPNGTNWYKFFEMELTKIE